MRHVIKLWMVFLVLGSVQVRAPLAGPGPFALYGVSFTDVNTGTAVGQRGTILRTLDGGVTWIDQFFQGYDTPQ